MWLPDQVFKTVIQSTPLISIDLVVRNEKNEVLLGKRLNAPAKGFWFVPGGRVQKDETLDSAFIRLLREELDSEFEIAREQANFLGVFEHFYEDNFYEEDFTTHYIVMGYEIKISQSLIEKLSQHSDFKWINTSEMISDESIHQYTKNYFYN
ncbi:GDP-mannose mannosyl hydrolase [uncultured Acinetobacter sp.]|uniref:GDP-mannose mannosyl hydrolase n=1 Tax=uncultured Acinetobacter sp. TaxID=165433 RepID=UPI00258FE2A6|nr:GDP-mannose mannosyl hydrolase [uncultured Acinetobacter sp.]